MALVFEKVVGDKVVILEPREAAIRIPLASANAWTELRIGMFMSLTDAAAPNAAYVDEALTTSTVFDRFAFGLKNSDNDDLPGVAGVDFWGTLGRNGVNASLSDTQFNPGTAASANPYTIANGTTLNIDSTSEGTSGNWRMASKALSVTSTNFARFWGMSFVITNRGLSTQTVQMRRSYNGATNSTDTSESALRALLVNFPSHQVSIVPSSLAANDGAVAWDVPDAFFFRMPLLSSRVRLHNVMVMQAVP